MRPAAGAAIAGSESRNYALTRGPLIEWTLLFPKALHSSDPDTRRRQQVIDMPMQSFAGREVAPDPCLHPAPCAARIDVAAPREPVLAESAHAQRQGPGDQYQELITPRPGALRDIGPSTGHPRSILAGTIPLSSNSLRARRAPTAVPAATGIEFGVMIGRRNPNG